MKPGKTKEKFADVREHLPFLRRHDGVADVLEWVLRYPKVRKAFADSEGSERPFHEAARRLGLGVRVEGVGVKIPATGPVVVVANHAHGGADALALMVEMHDHRPDFKVLANREVTLLPGVESVVFPVSLFGTGDTSRNSASVRAMLRHVRAGGALGVFPAGRVAIWKGDRMVDPVWNQHVVKLLLRMDATIVPVWFFGNPPASVNLLSQFSTLVRTALIPTGLAMMEGREVTARVGEPIPAKEFQDKGEGAGDWLRAKLESLSDFGN